MPESPPEQLEILHDHYKETFARIREAESYRDRLLLWVVALAILLSLEISSPLVASTSLPEASFGGLKVDLRAIPLHFLLSSTWVVVLATVLRYCQVTVLVNRQYPYLHSLEESISPLVGGGTLYQREGQVYLDSYPPLLNVAWFAYTLVFPLIAIFGFGILAIWEWRVLLYPLSNRLFDSLLAICAILVVISYRFYPALKRKRTSGRWFPFANRNPKPIA